MTKEELLRLENVFIKLRSEGKSLEEIKTLMGDIEVSLLNEWDSSYNTAASTIPSNSPVKITISGKNEKGEYLYQNQLSLKLSTLEKIKFDLWRAASYNLEKVDEKDPVRVEHLKLLVNQSKEYGDIFSKYFVNIEFEWGKEEGAYTAKYNLNTDDPTILTKAEDAIKFYLSYFLAAELSRSKTVLIEKVSTDKYGSASAMMPSSLKQIRIQKYQGIENAEISDIPVDTKWIFITGENGYGKTTFLRAIAIGLLGNQEDNRILVQEDSGALISLEFKDDNQNKINNVWALGFEPIKKIACYGPSRLQLQAKQTQNEIDKQKGITYSLFEPDGVLLNIEYELVIWYLAKDPRFNLTKAIFLKLIPNLSDISIVNDREVLYFEKEAGTSDSPFGPVSFDSLASGIRSLIAMVGDMIIRLLAAQPHIKDPSDLSGIVLIDELDLHWHPKWQRELPSLLSNVFPKIQFIVTTHSVIPFLGAPKQSVFLKVTRTKEMGVQINRVDIDIKNLLPNILLTSSLFDMDSIKQINNENLSEIRTEDDFNSLKLNDKAIEILKNVSTNSKKYPDSLFE